MPGLRASQIAARIKTTTVDFGEDGTLSVSYRPDFYSLSMESALNGAEAAESDSDKATAFKKFLPQFLSAVKSWDLVDDMGQVIPVTEDGIRASNLGLSTLAFILRTCIQDTTPDPQKPRA